MTIVAIDGPAGAGKSSVAARVARALKFQLIDTGAMYRMVAFRMQAQGVDIEDSEACAKIARALHFRFAFEGEDNVMWCDDTRIGDEIRTPQMSQFASRVSTHADVRQALVEVQRAMAREHDCVLEGRDIGTVVFPDADTKVFLTASPEVRAHRRVIQMQERGESADYDAILSDIKERDERDMNREHAPLRAADDAFLVDSSTSGMQTIVDRIVGHVRAQQSRCTSRCT